MAQAEAGSGFEGAVGVSGFAEVGRSAQGRPAWAGAVTASPVTSGPKRESCEGRSHEWILVGFDHAKPNADTYFCLGCGERRIMPSLYLPAQRHGVEEAMDDEDVAPWEPSHGLLLMLGFIAGVLVGVMV